MAPEGKHPYFEEEEKIVSSLAAKTAWSLTIKQNVPQICEQQPESDLDTHQSQKEVGTQGKFTSSLGEYHISPKYSYS